MAGLRRARWSLWKAALFGCIPSAYLVLRHFMGDLEPYPSQTTAGQIAYWFGYAGMWPVLFVIVAMIRNAFIPRDATEERKPSPIMNFIWPTKLKEQPSGVARFGRVLHWLFALGALSFVIGGGYTMLIYGDFNSGLALIAFGGGICLLVGRALRYIFAGE